MPSGFPGFPGRFLRSFLVRRWCTGASGLSLGREQQGEDQGSQDQERKQADLERPCHDEHPFWLDRGRTPDADVGDQDVHGHHI